MSAHAACSAQLSLQSLGAAIHSGISAAWQWAFDSSFDLDLQDVDSILQAAQDLDVSLRLENADAATKQLQQADGMLTEMIRRMA